MDKIKVIKIEQKKFKSNFQLNGLHSVLGRLENSKI